MFVFSPIFRIYVVTFLPFKVQIIDIKRFTNTIVKYRPFADKTTGKLRARKRKQRMTSECYSTEACRHGRLVALVEVEPERLHHVKQTEHNYCRQDRASYSVSVCIERIFSL